MAKKQNQEKYDIMSKRMTYFAFLYFRIYDGFTDVSSNVSYSMSNSNWEFYCPLGFHLYSVVLMSIWQLITPKGLDTLHLKRSVVE